MLFLSQASRAAGKGRRLYAGGEEQPLLPCRPKRLLPMKLRITTPGSLWEQAELQQLWDIKAHFPWRWVSAASPSKQFTWTRVTAELLGEEIYFTHPGFEQMLQWDGDIFMKLFAWICLKKVLAATWKGTVMIWIQKNGLSGFMVDCFQKPLVDTCKLLGPYIFLWQPWLQRVVLTGAQ